MNLKQQHKKKKKRKEKKKDYLIDSTFRIINRLFVLSFKNGDDYPIRNSFDEYYLPLAEIKDFNALIDNQSFFDQPVKTNKKRMKNLSKCQEIIIIQQEIYQIFGIIKIHINLLVYIYQDKQIQAFLKKNSFTGKLGKEEGVTMPFIIKKQQKTILNVSLEASIVTK